MLPPDTTSKPSSGVGPLSNNQSSPASWFTPAPGEARSAAVQLVDRARQAGARHAEVFALRTHALRADHARGVVERQTDFRFTVRVWQGSGAFGVATGHGFDPDAATRQQVVEQAMANADRSQGEAGPPPRLDIPERGLDIRDRRLPQLDDDLRRGVLRGAVDGAMQADRRVTEADFRYEELQATRCYASTNELAAEEHGTRFALIGSVQADNHPIRVRGQLVSRNFAEVASRPLGHQLGTRLVATLTPADLPSAPTSVVFDQRAVAALLPRIVPAFSAERIARGESYLKGRVGGRIASRELHVIDDARRPGGMASRGFDERGVSPVAINLIKEGRAAGLYQGPGAAEGVDARPSGHERSDGSLWPGNLIVRPGSRSRNMVYPELGTFVFVDEITDSGGVDPNTGMIDVGALVFVADASGTHGCAGIQRLRCSADALLSGIQRVCNDQQRHGIVDTATWVVDGVWFE